MIVASREPCCVRTSETTSDAELIVDLCAEKGEALEILFRRYRRLIHRVAAGILRDAGEAEDMTQEVFFEVYRKAHLYDPARGSVKVWLLQYAYHRSLRRKESLRLRASYRGEPLDEIPHVPDAGYRALTRQECRWILHAGLAQLPERQRAALELVCIEELSLRDVADRLRVSLGCARHYYYRGLARLRTWAAVGARSSPEAAMAQRPRHQGSPRGDDVGALIA